MERRRSPERINSMNGGGGQLSSPFTENNTSPVRRKSIPFGLYNKSHAEEESPKSPAHPSLLRNPNSSLQRTSNSSPSARNRKSHTETPRRLRKQSSADDLQSRGLWPSSKKLNPSAHADADAGVAPEPLARDHDDDRRIDPHGERPAATYKFSTFSSRQRDQPGGERGSRSLRYHVGKIYVERSMAKPGTPPSPSSSSSSGRPPPLGRVHSGRFSFNDTAMGRKKSDCGIDFRSMEFERSESVGTSPRISLSTVRRPISPMPLPVSQIKDKGGGVGSLISQGFNNLFRRKSFQGVHAESVTNARPTAASAGAGSPGKERAVKAKVIGSPGRETVGSGRTIGSPTRGTTAVVEGEMQQMLKMMHNYLIQWRFVNAGTVVVNQTKRVNAQRALLSASLGLSDLRISVMKKRVHLGKEKLKFKMNKIMYHQTQGLERWSTVERQHLEALTSTKDSLQAAVCRLPITDHAKVDPHSLTVSLEHATDLADTINGNMAKNPSMAQTTAPLVAELAQVVAAEKLLLEDCMELLGLVSTLQVHEGSLRTHVMQLKSQQLMRCTEKGA